MKIIMALSLAIGVLFSSAVQADTIYGWTDEQGVQRFSNLPPPEGIKKFQKFENAPETPTDDANADERRKSYDRMVLNATEEARQIELRRQADAAARAAEQKRKAEALRNKKIQSERNRLQQQIEAINHRALGPYFTKGMKKAQIDKIRKQIEALEKNPDNAKSQAQPPASESDNGY